MPITIGTIRLGTLRVGPQGPAGGGGGADLSNATPQAVGTAAAGAAASASRADHVHAHGDQAGGSLHANAVTSGAAGFMSGADKAKLDNIEAGADVTDSANVAAAGAVMTSRTITAGTGLTGGGDLSANRTLAVSFGSSAGTACEGNDARLSNARTPTAHASTHQPGGADAIATAAAVELTDSTNAEGAATSLARSNHTHAHGDRGGGSLHAAATTSVAGFLSGADKTKLDAVYGFRSISTDASIAATDRFVLVDASAAARTPTLPAANTVAAGVGVVFKKQDAGTNTISLARTGADTIEGAGATYLLPGSDGTGRPAWMAVSDGTSAWWVA